MLVRVRLELLPTLAKGQKNTRKVTAKINLSKDDKSLGTEPVQVRLLSPRVKSWCGEIGRHGDGLKTLS